jgi:hypothetical protein
VVIVKRFLATFLIATLGLTIAQPIAQSADPKSTLPVTTPGAFALGICQSETSTECIVSVSTYRENGALFAGKHIEDVTFAAIKDGENTRIDGISIWEVQSETRTQRIQLRVDLETPARVIYKDQIGGALRILVENSNEVSVKVKIVVRTSWLKPQNVQLVAENSDFSEKVTPNFREWTFIGTKTNVSNYTDWLAASKNNFMDKADQDTTALHFIIHHVGISDSTSFFPIACADKGYTVQSWNSSAAGTPYWDKESSSLNFGIQSPHLKASGEQNKGFFTLWAPEEFIKCRWPENTLIGAAKITVEVLNPDGTQQIAVTSVKQENKTLYFSASGFHYSSPTIRVSAVKAPVETKPLETKPVEAKPTVALKKTITCIKGKSSKKVTAVSPKCPTGWKKK